MTARVTIDDLWFAENWLASYEADDTDEINGPARDRMVAWLRAEIARREEDAAVREVVVYSASQGRKVTPAQARKALRKVKAARS